MAGNLAESSDFHATWWLFYMPQICDMRPTALPENLRERDVRNMCVSVRKVQGKVPRWRTKFRRDYNKKCTPMN